MEFVYVLLLIGILFAIDLLFVTLWNFINKRPFDYIHKQDSTIAFTLFLIIAIATYVFDHIYFPNLFVYFLLACTTGVFLEFIFGYSWFRLMGTRLYRYYSKEFLGFTSLYVVPVWGLGGLVFFFCIKFLIDDPILNLSLRDQIAYFLIGGGFTSLLVYIISFAINSLNKGFTFSKYFTIVSFIWGGIFSVAFITGYDILIYVLVSSLIALILEILMGLIFPSLFGQRLWIYKRFPILGGVSSFLMFPIWGIASITMFFLVQAVF